MRRVERRMRKGALRTKNRKQQTTRRGGLEEGADGGGDGDGVGPFGAVVFGGPYGG